MNQQQTEDQHTDASDDRSPRRGLDSTAAVLWASAFILMGMIISQLGNVSPNLAFAEDAISNGAGQALMTTDAGSSREEFVTVVDSPTQQLYVYIPTVRDGFKLLARVDLAEAFAQGRRAAQ